MLTRKPSTKVQILYKIKKKNDCSARAQRFSYSISETLQKKRVDHCAERNEGLQQSPQTMAARAQLFKASLAFNELVSGQNVHLLLSAISNSHVILLKKKK